MTIDPQKIARRAVQDIITDIVDRRGLDVIWSQLDDEMRRELRKHWEGIILACFEAEQNPPPILRFAGQYRFLSNFYPSPIRVTLVNALAGEDLVFPTVEHAYQALKVAPGPYRAIRMRAFANPELTAGEVKRMGRKVQLRPDWEEVKLDLMEGLLVEKFLQHKDLADKLLETGSSQLVEGNGWGDRFWGVTLYGYGEGENHLGRLLMRVRDQVRFMREQAALVTVETGVESLRAALEGTE